MTALPCATCVAPTAFLGYSNLNSPTPSFGGDNAAWQYSCAAGYYGSPSVLSCNASPTALNGTAITAALYTSLRVGGSPLNSTGIFGPFSGSAVPNCTACNVIGGGFYCLGGTSTAGANGLGRLPCPPGSYAPPAPAAPAATTTCSPCLAGYYCPNNGTASGTFAQCGSSVVYCPAGSTQPTPIPSGAFYGTPVGAWISPTRSTTSNVFSGYAACPATSVCSQGFIVPPVDFSGICSAPSGGSATVTVLNGVTNQAFGPSLTPGTQNPTGLPLALDYIISDAVALDTSCAGAFGAAALFSTSGLGVAANTTSTPGLVSLTAGGQLLLGPGYTFSSARGPNGFSFTLLARRSLTPSLNATCSVKIAVAQTILAPTFSFCGNVSLQERSGAGAEAAPAIQASTTNTGTTIKYFVRSAPANFLVNSCSGVVSSTTDLAWTTAPSYPMTVTAVNDGSAIGLGNASSTCSFFVVVKQNVLPAAPTVTSFVIPELSPVGTPIGSLQIVDPAGYAISSVAWASTPSKNVASVDGQGNIAVALVVDTLAAGFSSNYNYRVNVTNAYGVRATYNVLVIFSTVARPPIVQAQTVSILANATAGTAATPALIASSPGGLAMTYSVSPSTVFSVNSATGVLTLNSGQSLQTAFFPPPARTLTLTCTSSGGSTSAQVTVTIVEVPLAPIFNTQPPAWAFTVAEGSIADSAISLAVQANALLANPAYSGASTTYRLLAVNPSPGGYTPFAVKPTNGDVVVGPAPLNGQGNTLLYDPALAYPAAAPGLYQLTVAAVDRSGLQATGIVNVTIVNVRPRPLASNFSLSLASTAGAVVANLSAASSVWTPPGYNRANLRFSIPFVLTPNVNNAALQAPGVPAFDVNAVTGIHCHGGGGRYGHARLELCRAALLQLRLHGMRRRAAAALRLRHHDGQARAREPAARVARLLAEHHRNGADSRRLWPAALAKLRFRPGHGTSEPQCAAALLPSRRNLAPPAARPSTPEPRIKNGPPTTSP